MKTGKKSAGILLYRKSPSGVEVLLVHPGGPFWAGKNEGSWGIPKGEFSEEPGLEAARREFREELGFEARGEFHELKPIRQSGGKWVYAWALEGNCDPASPCSNTFNMEWPPRSGRVQTFPEIDRAEWFTIDLARTMILPSQEPLLTQLAELLSDVKTG